MGVLRVKWTFLRYFTYKMGIFDVKNGVYEGFYIGLYFPTLNNRKKEPFP
jgi:hypothetical protein